MNTLYIDNGKITLIGFQDLIDTDYFTFRIDDIVISTSKPDTILPTECYSIQNKKITDLNLLDKLITYGFLQNHSFTKVNDMYICLYPKNKE